MSTKGGRHKDDTSLDGLHLDAEDNDDGSSNEH
jgi:hypothetical protein